MNTRTKEMTTMAVIAYVILGFALFTPLSLTYKIVAYVIAGVVWACSHYFNQDFTVEACEGTGYGRYLKAQKRKDVWTEPMESEEEVENEQDKDR